MVDAEMTASPRSDREGRSRRGWPTIGSTQTPPPLLPRQSEHLLAMQIGGLTGEVATDLEAGFRCPLAPAHRSAPGLAINIFRCVGRGRGSPGRSEAERRGPPSSGQVQSQISGASGQPVASRGCLAERAAARRPPEGGTPEHRSRVFNLSLRRPSGGVRLVVLLHGQRDQIELDLDGEEARAPIVALSELRGVRRRAQHAEVA